MKLDPSYRNQHGCRDCNHKVIVSDYECYDVYLCGLTGLPRPKFDSLAMGETWGKNEGEAFKDRNEERYKREREIWGEWADGRMVSPHGICDFWQSERHAIWG